MTFKHIHDGFYLVEKSKKKVSKDELLFFDEIGVRYFKVPKEKILKEAGSIENYVINVLSKERRGWWL